MPARQKPDVQIVAPPPKPIPGGAIPLALQIKLASLIVHYEELNAPGGHGYDQVAIDALRVDPEVVEYMDGMKSAGFLPLKRSERR